MLYYFPSTFCFLYFSTPTEESLEEKQVGRPNIPVPRGPSPFWSSAQPTRTLLPDGTVLVSVSQLTSKLLSDCFLYELCLGTELCASDLSDEFKLANKIVFQGLSVSFTLSLRIYFVLDVYPMAENQGSKISAGESTLHICDNLLYSGLGFVASTWLN